MYVLKYMNNNDLSNIFSKIGISNKEASVYITLLKLGGAYPSKIAEETKINRSTVYKILLDLSIKGLVNEIERKNKIYYQVESPNKLLKFAKKQVDLANGQLKNINKIMPDLDGIHAMFLNKPKIFYFEGLSGILSIYEDHITTTKKYKMLAFANATELENILPKQFFAYYIKTKNKLKITTRGIITGSEKNNTFIERMYASYNKDMIPKTKIVPTGNFSFKGELTIYKENRISIVNLNKQHLTGIIIEDEAIFNMMTMLFELSWNGAENYNHKK